MRQRLSETLQARVVDAPDQPITDAQHIAVEFVHPVIVGKRALPAISLTPR